MMQRTWSYISCSTWKGFMSGMEMSGIRDQGCSNCKYGGTHPIELFLSTKFTIEGVLLSIFFKEPKRLLLHTPSFFNFFSSSSLRRWTAARISHPLRFSGDGRECFSTPNNFFSISNSKVWERTENEQWGSYAVLPYDIDRWDTQFRWEIPC